MISVFKPEFLKRILRRNDVDCDRIREMADFYQGHLDDVTSYLLFQYAGVEKLSYKGAGEVGFEDFKRINAGRMEQIESDAFLVSMVLLAWSEESRLRRIGGYKDRIAGSK